MKIPHSKCKKNILQLHIYNSKCAIFTSISSLKLLPLLPHRSLLGFRASLAISSISNIRSRSCAHQNSIGQYYFSLFAMFKE